MSGYKLLNEDQKSLVKTIDQFLTKELDPILAEYDAAGKMPMDVLEKGMDMGLHLLDVPEEYGGAGLDSFTLETLIATMSRHDGSLALTYSITSMLANAIITLGTQEQKDKFLPMIVNNGIMCFCLTEPSGSSEAKNMRTTAEKRGDKYVLNGTKIFITSAEYSKLFMVFAVTDRTAKGAHGISCFLVEAGTPGLIVGKHEDKIGARISATNEVAFVDCEIPAENMLGPEGEGFMAAMKVLDGGRMTVGACGLGVAERALAEAAKYANQRILFGMPLSFNQGVSFKLAEIDSKIEACYALIKYTCDLRDAGHSAAKQCAMCKLLGTDIAMEAATAAVQFFGGYGVCKDYPVEKLFRDAKCLQIVEGANEVQKLVIARSLLKEYR